MPVRSKRLFAGPVATVASFVPVYTAPAGETVILKHLVAFATNSVAKASFLRLTSGPTAVNLLAVTGAHPFSFREHVWVVLQPGDTLDLWQESAGSWTWVLSGAELEGVAD